MPFQTGAIIQQRYEIRMKLGIGDSARTYRAYDLQLNRELIIQESVPRDDRGQQIFLRAIEQLREIEHRLLPKIYDCFFEADSGCIAVEYIPGNTLSDYLDGLQHGLPIPLALTWGAQVLEALQSFHSHSPPLIHCDMKPSHVVIHAKSGEACLIDFGLFKRLGSSKRVAHSSDLAASESDSPSLSSTSPTWDIYAVGVMLYQMLTGQLPPKQRVVTTEELCSTHPSISPDLGQVITQAMAPDPDARFADANAMLRALQPFVTSSAHYPLLTPTPNEIDELQPRLSTGEQQQLAADLAQARATLEQSTAQVHEQEAVVERLQQRLLDEEQQRRGLEATAAQSQQELVVLRQQRDELEQQIAYQVSQLNALEQASGAEIKRMEEQRQATTTQLEQLRRRGEELERQVSDLTSQMQIIEQKGKAERAQLQQLLKQRETKLVQKPTPTAQEHGPITKTRIWLLLFVPLITMIFGGILGIWLAPRKVGTPDRPVTTELTTQQRTALALSVASATAAAIPSPTIDPAAQVEQDYEQGQQAIKEQDWPTAARLLQQVFDTDPNYRDIQKSLATTYYSWGIAARDNGDIGMALEQFLAALKINPEYPTATVERQKAQIFLGAEAAEQLGESERAIEGYRSLLAMHNDSYADASEQLYALLVAKATSLVQTGDQQQIVAAGNLYQEASGLKVSDTSTATQGIKEIETLLATPTPQSTKPPDPARLRFKLKNYNDDPRCISVQITGVVSTGWAFVVDGISSLRGNFDGSGNARLCGLRSGQEVTFTVFDKNGRVVAGGSGVATRGSAIMTATWK